MQWTYMAILVFLLVLTIWRAVSKPGKDGLGLVIVAFVLFGLLIKAYHNIPLD